MTQLRAAKVAKVADDIPPLEVDTDREPAEVLVLGWGSTYGTIKAAVRRVRGQGKRVDHAHLSHLSPLPKNTGDVVRAYPRVLIPEINTGQLVRLIRAEYLVDAESYTKVEGLPIFAAELDELIEARL
jgi:2-oxoglutarate ferredoxin oxidoreductase subunit alpha